MCLLNLTFYMSEKLKVQDDNVKPSAFSQQLFQFSIFFK